VTVPDGAWLGKIRNADLQVGLENKRAERSEAFLIDSLSRWERVLQG
jgi:hypothetical protein